MSLLEVTFPRTSPPAATPPPFARATSSPTATFSYSTLTTREENSLGTPAKRRIRKIAKCTDSTEDTYTTKDNYASRWEKSTGSLATVPWEGYLNSTTVGMSEETGLLFHPFINGSQSGIGGLRSNPSLNHLLVSTPVATHPLVENKDSSVMALPIRLEDLLSDDSIEEQDSESSEETESIVDQEECATFERAESFYHRCLLQRGMRGLIWNLLVQREIAKTIIQQHLRWKLAVLLRKDVNSHAVIVSQLLIDAVNDMEIELHMVQRLFTAWKVMAHESRSQTAALVFKADRFHCSKVLEKGFLVWRAWVLHLAECRWKASAKLQNVHIRVTIQKWRELSSSQTVLRLPLTYGLHVFDMEVDREGMLCSERMNLVRKRKVLQRCFLVWKEALKSVVTLRCTQNVYRLKCKRSVFEAWKIYVYRCTLKKLGIAYADQRRATQLQVSFNCWLCQAVSVKGEGLLSSRLFTVHQRAQLLKAFNGWLTVTRLSQAHSTVKKMHQMRILDAFFQIWKTSWIHCKFLQAKANQMNQLRLRAAFAKWKHCLERCKQEKLAVQYHELHHIVKAFSTWKVEYQRQASLSIFADLRVHAQLKARFAQWRTAVWLQQEARNLQRISQFYHQKILRKCFSKWSKYCGKQKDALAVCSKTLQSKLWKLRAESVLKVWRWKLQCRELVRRHLAGKQQLLAQRCFSAWRKLTVDTYMHISQLFFSKVQLALSSEPQFTASIDTQSCLGNIFSNLGIPISHHSVVTNTDLWQMQATRSLEFPGVLQQSAALYSCSRDGAEARHGGFWFESTPIVSSDLCTLQSFSKPIPSSLRQLWDHDLSSSVQWPPCQEVSLSDHIPVNRQLFATSGHVISSDAGEASFSGAELYDNRSCAQLSFCSCLDSKIVDEIQDVQQKLSHVSATLDESAVEADFSNNLGTSHSPENTEAFPILPPPPGFGLDGTVVDSEHVVLNKSGASLHTYLQNAKCQLQYELPTPLPQLVHTVRYMQLYPCSKAFNAWTLYLKKKTQLREKLECVRELSRVKTIRTSFQTWRELSCKLVAYKAVEVQHLAQVHACIVRTFFKSWKKRTEMVLAYHEAQRKAVVFDNLICMRIHFVKWKMAYQAVAESKSTQVSMYILQQLFTAPSIAIRTCSDVEFRNAVITHLQNYYQTVLVRSIFHCWVRHAVRRHLIRRMLTKWKHAAKVKKQRKQAETVGKYWILSNAWKTWRVSYIQRKTVTLLTTQNDKELLRQLIMMNSTLERSALLEQVDDESGVLVLAAWRVVATSH